MKRTYTSMLPIADVIAQLEAERRGNTLWRVGPDRQIEGKTAEDALANYLAERDSKPFTLADVQPWVRS